MTDNEIIETIEYCKNRLVTLNQQFIELIDFKNKKINELFEIIKRRDAEIKRLQKLIDDMGQFFPGCIDCEGKTEFGERTDKCVYLTDTGNYCIERGIKNIIAMEHENLRLKEGLKTARAETINDFAERLKKKTFPLPCAIGVEYAVSLRTINDLAKEMTEETTC